MDKKQIRDEINKKKELYDEEKLMNSSGIIMDRLIRLPEYFSSNVLLCYASMEKEVDTYGLILSALISGKQVYLPKIIEKGIMEFYRLNRLEELKVSKYGILEPTTEVPVTFRSSFAYTMIMPGVAFDENLHRIGYGGGFYDRYLMKMNGFPIKTIAVAFDFQVYQEVPSESFDYQPDILVTERRILIGS